MVDSAKVIGIARTDEQHILFANKGYSLCEKKIENESVDILPDYRQPHEVTDNLCEECESEFNSWLNENGVRAPTVRCQCDLLTNGGVETCETIVSAYKARELSHPFQDENVPICPSCYQWIRSLDENSVTTEYKKATPWLSKSKPSELQEQTN